MLLPKPEPRKKQKARLRRDESKVIKSVRADVAARDGYCRLRYRDRAVREAIETMFGPCGGESEWAHLGDHRRFKTTRKPVWERHTTGGSCMLCSEHHRGTRGYDSNAMEIEFLTEDGANGKMKFSSEFGMFVES